MNFQLLHINLPEFTCRQSFNIVSILKSLNIKDIFTKNAQLFKLSNYPTCLHTILNFGILSVNNYGVGIDQIQTVFSNNKPTNFPNVSNFININIDRPFIFLIFDHSTHLILYSSIIIDPSKF